jgi:hypothetical protein
MGRLAEHVYTDQTSIRKIKSLIEELPTNGHVVLLMKDGSSWDGIVCVRPNVQMFRDPDEREGINAEVQLERPDVPEWRYKIWLDEIARVEHLDSVMASEN